MNIRQLPSRIVFEAGNLIASMFEIKQEPPATPVKEPNVGRTLRRLKRCKAKMKKMGILSTEASGNYTPPAKGESVQVVWHKHGWMPPHNGLQFKAAEQEIVSDVVELKRRAAK